MNVSGSASSPQGKKDQAEASLSDSYVQPESTSRDAASAGRRVASKDSPVSMPVQHSKHFVTDGYVKFLVEGTLFRVDRHVFLRDSEHFRSVLGKPSGSDRGEKGVDPIADSEPVRLEGVKAVDFERFLDILYPSDFGRHSLTTLDEWTSVLHLSSMWGFETVRALAVGKVEDLASPVDMICLGNKFSIEKWLLGAYVALCAREEALTSEEGHRLGMDDVVRISALRQALRPHNQPIPAEAIEHAVRSTFQIPGQALALAPDGAAAPGVVAHATEMVVFTRPQRAFRALITFKRRASAQSQGSSSQRALPAPAAPLSGHVSSQVAVVDRASAAKAPPLAIEAASADDAFKSVMKALDSDLGWDGAEFVLPRVAAWAGNLDLQHLRALARLIADAVEKDHGLLSSRLMHRLLGKPTPEEILPSLRDEDGTVFSRAGAFTDCLMDCFLGLEGRARLDDRAPCVPRKKALSSALFVMDAHLAEFVTRRLPRLVVKLDKSNACDICDVLSITLQRWRNSNHLHGQMEQMVTRVVGAMQPMGGDRAERAEALRYQWEDKKRSA